MVNATVDNQPVSIQLSPGQSTNVPSNETWRVQITLAVIDSSGGSQGAVKINGVAMIGSNTGNEYFGKVAPQTVVTGGDTISLDGGVGCTITGFVVNS